MAKNLTAKRKTLPPTVLVIGVLALIALVWGGIALFSSLNKSTANYAEEEAKPLEDALVKAGGVKVCSRGDAGRGSDNVAPNYAALFELPVDREGATKLLEATVREGGYELFDNSASVDAGDNKLYADRAGRISPYSDLESGEINLLATVFGSSTYTGNGDPFCTVTKRDNLPSDKTTVDITVNLPAFKRSSAR